MRTPFGVGDLDESRARGAQLRFVALPVGDVAQVAGERRRAGKPDPRDRQLDRELRPVLVHAGQLEPLVEDHGVLGLEEAREAPAMLGAQRLRHDQVGHVAADRLVRAPAERRLGRVVPVDDAPALIHRDHGVERGLEHRAEPRLARAHLRLGVSSRDELADLAAEHAHRLEHVRIRLARLVREELHHADDPSRAAQREPERRVQAGAPGGVGAREVPVRRTVDDPGRLPGLEHAPRKPFAGLEREPLAQRLEVRCAVARVPRAARTAAARRPGPVSQTAPSSQPSARPIASSAAA